MNQEIKDKLLWRATIIENSESLIRSCSRNDKAQLSLFEETKHETITLEIPEINPEDWVRKESDVLGVSLTYNIQDRYILHSKRFCNSTLRSINELTESGDKLIFIARIDEIEYRKSLAGNNYARINWKDYDSEAKMFLFGDKYQKLISRAFTGRYYLCECLYNKDKESLSIVNFKAIEDIIIEDSVSTIMLEVENPYLIAELRNYIFKKMIGTQYNLVFLYKGDKIEAPYKINFTEENYCDIKELIINIYVKK